jgi:hypothetical protein
VGEVAIFHLFAKTRSREHLLSSISWTHPPSHLYLLHELIPWPPPTLLPNTHNASEWFRDIAGLKGNLNIVHGLTMKVTELEGAREEESRWVVFRDGLTTGEAGHQLLTVTVVVAGLGGSHPAIGELLSEAFLRLRVVMDQALKNSVPSAVCGQNQSIGLTILMTKGPYRSSCAQDRPTTS